MTSSNNAEAWTSRISWFDKVDNNFRLAVCADGTADLILERPYNVNAPYTNVKIYLDDIVEYVDRTPAQVCMYGTVMTPEKTSQQEVIKTSTYYGRTDDSGKIYDMVTGEEVEANPILLPWFFVYRAKELPLYYIVLNPNNILLVGEVEGEIRDNKVFGITNHLRDMNSLLFKPNFSRNVKQIGQHNLAVSGDEFTIEVFSTWFVKRHIPDFFKEANVKVDTNFEFTQEGTKFKFNARDTKRGYVILRWNTGSTMDMSFYASGNRFYQDFVVDIYDK
jgi:hypothetical protein